MGRRCLVGGVRLRRDRRVVAPVPRRRAHRPARQERSGGFSIRATETTRPRSTPTWSSSCAPG
jgi:hypothetical protein